MWNDDTMKCNANVGSMLEHIYTMYETQKNQVALTGIRTTDQPPTESFRATWRASRINRPTHVPFKIHFHVGLHVWNTNVLFLCRVVLHFLENKFDRHATINKSVICNTLGTDISIVSSIVGIVLPQGSARWFVWKWHSKNKRLYFLRHRFCCVVSSGFGKCGGQKVIVRFVRDDKRFPCWEHFKSSTKETWFFRTKTCTYTRSLHLVNSAYWFR
jgi:hypothetical protein